MSTLRACNLSLDELAEAVNSATSAERRREYRRELLRRVGVDTQALDALHAGLRAHGFTDERARERIDQLGSGPA